MKPLRWRRRRSQRFETRNSLELHRDNVVYAVAQESSVNGAWFVYGLKGASFNTASHPTALDEAKRFAESRCRAALEQEGK